MAGGGVMKLAISEITIDPQIQLKARRLDNDTVTAYVEAMTNGDKFPPITVFSEDGTNWLAGGFHRIAAARFLGLAEIDTEVRQGTKQDAMVFAATDNAAHGRPMKPAEKQEAGKRLIELTDWGDTEIAQKLACTRMTVNNWRRDGVKNFTDENVKESTPEIPGLIDLICGDFEKIANDIEPGIIDVIITDPPYPQEYLYLYEVLAKHAERLLKPNGLLLAMAGQSYLPAIFDMMKPYLAYQWVISYLTPGGQSPQLWQRKVNSFWKPVLWFVNGDYTGPWVGDVAKSAVNDNDKRFHEWGQSESGFADLVERFSKQGDLILDPFCGGGTTGFVALKLNRRFIGVDIDPANIETTRDRLSGITG